MNRNKELLRIGLWSIGVLGVTAIGVKTDEQALGWCIIAILFAVIVGLLSLRIPLLITPLTS